MGFQNDFNRSFVKKATDCEALLFSDGLKYYGQAIAMLRTQPEMRRWYWAVILKTVVLSLAALFVFLVFGGWGIYLFAGQFFADGVAQVIGGAVFTLVFITVVLYFSGTIGFSLASSLVGLLSGEDRMMSLLFGPRRLKRPQISDLLREWKAMGWTLGTSLMCIPLFIPVLTIPLAVLLMSACYGREALAMGNRLQHQAGQSSAIEHRPVTWSFQVGLGLIPAMVMLVPALGWFFVPVGLIAGTLAHSKARVESEAVIPSSIKP